MWRTLLILGRVSNLPTVWTNILAGWFLAGGGWSAELLWLAAGASLLYVAGMTLNDACDAAWDRQHAPERPIPSGAISSGAAWGVGVVQLLAGGSVLLFATGASWIWVAGLAGAILLYDGIHKKTAAAVLVMGACRGLVYLLAASAAAEQHLPGAWAGWWALAAGLHVVGITVAARSERVARGNQRGWALALLFAPVLALAAGMASSLGILALVAPLPWLAWTLSAVEEQRRDGATGAMVGRLIAGLLLIDLAILAMLHAWPAVLLAWALLPLTRLLQRHVPAT